MTEAAKKPEVKSEKEIVPAKKRDNYLDWIDVIEDRENLQISNKEDGRHYRWVRSQDPRRVDKFKRLGYRIENKDKHQVESPYSDEETGKAHILNNELVLMSCDMDEYNARTKAKNIINKRKTERAPAPLVVKDSRGKAYKEQLNVELENRN